MATAAGIRECFVGKRVHDLAVVPYREMNVRKFSGPGKPDQADGLACADRIAHLDAQTAFSHVAILGAPAIAVLDNDTIAAFLSRDGLFGAGANGNVFYAIPYAGYRSCR